MLALTSNKEGPEVQHATHRRPRAGHRRRHRARPPPRPQRRAARPLGDLGAVIGATIGDSAEDLDFNGPVLAPGFGAQGGTVDDLRRIFGPVARHVLPSSSREVLSAGPDPTALRDAARRGNDAVAALGRRMRRRVLLVPVLTALVTGPTAGCSSEQETYCQAVEDHQAELSDVAASGEPGAVLGALDAYRDLRDGGARRPPRRVVARWSPGSRRSSRPSTTPGVDPASYDPETTPQGLPGRRPPGDRGGRPRPRDEAETVEAMGGIEQQALDVCKAPLSQ